MTHSLLFVDLIVSCAVLAVVAVWAWHSDHSTYVGRVSLWGLAWCAVWGATLALLVSNGPHVIVQLLWFPSATATAASIYLVTKAANAPAWRPPRC